MAQSDNPTSRFCMIPHYVLFSDVSMRAKLLFGVIQTYLTGREGSAFPSRKRLAEQLDTSTASIDRALAELKEIGAVEPITRTRDDGGQTSNEYVLYFDEPATQERRGRYSEADSPLSTFEEGGLHGRVAKNKTHSTRTNYQDPVKKNASQTAEAFNAANLLADLIAEHGAKRPSVTNQWFIDLERMHRLDGVPWERIEGAIRYAQADDFWHQNILSPAKLRKHYDRLVLKAQSERRKQHGHTLTYIEQQLLNEDAG